MHAATEQAIADVQKYVDAIKSFKADAASTATDEDTTDLLVFGITRIFRKHAVALAKARALTITGDTTHPSVRSKIKLLEDIDKPREYDFQPEDHNERELIRMLEHFGLPQFDMRLADELFLHPDVAIAALKGEAPITVSLGYQGECYDCGDKMLVTFNGTNIHYTAVNGACKSNAVFDIEIDFPTGVVVFGDWPDRFSEMGGAGMLPTKSFDLNSM